MIKLIITVVRRGRVKRCIGLILRSGPTLGSSRIRFFPKFPCGCCQRPSSTATCFLVRDPDSLHNPDVVYIVSTAHAFEHMRGDEALLVLRRLKENGSYERSDQRTVIRRDRKALWHRHAKQDVAIFQIDVESRQCVSPLAIDCLADDQKLADSEVEVCDPLFIFTYPERMEANGSGFPVARQGIFSSPPRLSPAGIITGQMHHNEKIEYAYETRKIQHTLRIGRVSLDRYVRETIDGFPHCD